MTRRAKIMLLITFTVNLKNIKHRTVHPTASQPQYLKKDSKQSAGVKERRIFIFWH